MMLVEDGRIGLDDPVARWLPELASPIVVRTPGAPIDDVVPAVRPITVVDLLTFRAGYGFPSDFSLPAVGPLFTELGQGPPQPQLVEPPDAVDGRAVTHSAAAPAGRGVAVQHLFRHPRGADRQGLGRRVARVPGRSAVRAARHGRHRVRGTGRRSSTGSSATTGRIPRAVWNWSMPPTASGAACRRSRPAPAGSSRPSMTGAASAGCCSPKGASTAAADCSRLRRCDR